jgi:hypothetical protein
MALRVLGEDLFFDALCAFSDGLLLRAFQLNQGITFRRPEELPPMACSKSFTRLGIALHLSFTKLSNEIINPSSFHQQNAHALGVLPIPLYRIPAT